MKKSKSPGNVRKKKNSHMAAFFAERRDRADFAAFDKIMWRKGGKAPQLHDKIT